MNIVKKLRLFSSMEGLPIHQVCSDAADEIEKLQAENQKLEEALEPFVYAYKQTELALGVPPENIYTTANCVSTPYIKMADYVKANEALKQDP